MLKKPKNENYAAVVIEIKTLVPLEGCNNVKAAIIMGQQVVVSNSVKPGDKGLYFPVECALSKEYLSENNLYRKQELNKIPEAKGYFEENGRIRCIKFRGHKSEGLFMPMSSLSFTKITDLKVDECFDELNNIPICKKYIVKENNIQSSKTKSEKLVTKVPKLVENQFRFHEDTSQLYRNLHKVHPDDLISITYKMHGTSGISSRVLCNKPLTWAEKVLKKLKVNVVTTDYDYIFSSRKVIKNDDINLFAQHYYGENIWGHAHKQIEPFLDKGMTFYYEIVGYMQNGGWIQKPYDYGYIPYPDLPKAGERLPFPLSTFGVYIYRITQTNVDGRVFEYNAKQVQDFCKSKGLKAVPQLYYGYAKDFFNHLAITPTDGRDIAMWREGFLQAVKNKFNEKDCFMCEGKLPEEGCVIRIEKNDLETYKCKSTRFYEYETAQIDKGEIDIETLTE